MYVQRECSELLHISANCSQQKFMFGKLYICLECPRGARQSYLVSQAGKLNHELLHELLQHTCVTPHQVALQLAQHLQYTKFNAASQMNTGQSLPLYRYLLLMKCTMNAFTLTS